MERTAILVDIPSDIVPPPELRSLSLSEHSAAQMLTWVGGAGLLPNIHSLTLPCLLDADIPIVRKALRQIGGALHHLDLALYGEMEGAGILKMIDLSLHQSLRILRIHVKSGIVSFLAKVQETISRISTVILQLAAPSLERITLELLLFVPGFEGFDWTALDAFLVPPRFPYLHSVVVKCEDHDDGVCRCWQVRDREVVPSLFPAISIGICGEGG
ncbi:hypothetical protein C8R45DRAFT_431398 [Mycena sanguinolenta]|nr:hypothetical protein C8R45DRAFT_431398 [Mycena sanguinolenta]